jgi:uncharacterized protein (DUF1800 family)
MADKALEGAIAVTRFGLGARPGEIEEASRDPRGWLLAQIRREGADQPVTAPLPATPAPAPPPPPKPTAVMAGADMASGPVPPGTNAKLQTEMAMSAPTGAMAPTPPAPPAMEQPKTDFGLGQPLPTMRAAYRTFLDYRAAVQGAKADPELRRQASLPIYELVAEEALARARLATTTPAGFRERWFLFWANHFTVAAKNQDTTVAVGPFEREAIRPHIFDGFANLLAASSMHPGMILYLDQAQSIGPDSQAGLRRGGGLNENLAREIMELHSVGADAGYTQADVTEFARALTGWSVGGRNPKDEREVAGNFFYRDNFHEPGQRNIFGHRYDDDGGKQAMRVLIDLAQHPATARRLSTKIARHFVADDPPPALVAHLEQVWIRTGGDLGRVAEALVTSKEAFAPAELKLKTPYEFIISTYRAADFEPTNPAREVVQPLNALGQRPFGAAQPNGWSDVSADWAAPDAIVKRLTWAQGFASAHTPLLPPPDLARAVLGQRLTPNTLTYVSRAESRPEAFALLVMSPEFQRR